MTLSLPAAIGAAAGLLLGAGSAAAQILLPVLGGPGGGVFSAPCPAGQNLVGLDIRAADDVDAVRAVCAISYGAQQTGPSATSGEWHGGDGGSFMRLLCPASTPLLLRMAVDWEGEDTKVVNTLELFCGRGVVGMQHAADYPNARFDGPHYKPSAALGPFGVRGYDIQSDSETCPPGQVAVGIHGRSGVWLDAIGLMCDAPRLTGSALPVGRVNRSSPAPDRGLCEAASDARARNSPVAPSLTAQCQAYQAGLAPPVKSVGRANRGAPSPTGTLCDRAADARARNSPVAAHLEEQCQAAGGPQPPPDPSPVEAPPEDPA